jgi:hypothetical protein
MYLQNQIVDPQFFFSAADIGPAGQCCGAFFNTKPIFVNAGTCFTSHLEVWEVRPFTFSYIKVMLNVEDKVSPGKPFSFLGSASSNQGCQIFLGSRYQSQKKCTKRTQNVPNGHKKSPMFK